MRLHRRSLFAIVFALVALATSFALEAREGLVKIVVDETDARFVLYRLVDVTKDRYEALFFDQDPRTSSLTLSFDGRQYRLGDSAEFKQVVARTDSGVSIDFRSAFARVTERLDFARSAGASISDGIKLSIDVENVSQKEAPIGLRLIVDTTLAEKSGIQFATPTASRTSNETLYEGPAVPAWIATPGETSSFMVQFSGDGLSSPDRVHLANWKRLNETSWILDASSARNFSLLPYSINDSAIASYWLPKNIAAGGKESVTIAMGAFNEKGFPAAQANKGADELFSKTVLTQSASTDKKSLIESDLLAVRDLLTRIDLVLSSGSAPTSDEIAAWKRILDLLDQRRKGY
ncbi:MAG TPA: hypothetical protein VMV44_04190 [Rectinemataceae bacterium]|nr:hypothetical protein [Rectinemataceae bacterium]